MISRVFLYIQPWRFLDLRKMLNDVPEISFVDNHSLRQVDKVILELEFFLVLDLLQKLTVGYIFLDGYL